MDKTDWETLYRNSIPEHERRADKFIEIVNNLRIPGVQLEALNSLRSLAKVCNNFALTDEQSKVLFMEPTIGLRRAMEYFEQAEYHSIVLVLVSTIDRESITSVAAKLSARASLLQGKPKITSDPIHRYLKKWRAYLRYEFL